MLDLVVKNGRIIDGTGNPWFKADIGIKGGLITKIGSTNSLGVKRILDVRGFVVCPGFIDIHSHADKQRGEHGRLRAKSHLEQGITTEIVGNCGFSAAPFMGLHADNVVKRCETNLGFKVDWKTVGQFLNRIDRRGNGTNIAFLVGHGTLRECVMGLDNRPPNEEELSNMKRLLQEAMEDGAFGLSVGLMYEPGCWADSSELVELCHVVASHGGLLAADLRNWLDPLGFVDSLDEIIDIAKRANVPVEISHFKVKFPTLPLTEQTYKKMEEARERGIDITGDMLAFPQLPLSIQTYLECWIYEAARETLPRNLQAWLKSPENKEELKKKLNRLPLPWDIIRIFNVTSEKGKYLEGSTVQEIADSKGIEPIDLLLDFIVNGIVDTRLRLHARPAMEKVKLSMTFLPDTTSDDEPVARLQASHPAIMFGSDTAEATYPRFLRWHTREKGYLTLQEAIRKSTSFPAQRIGLKDRGLIKKGVWADLVVFDEETVGEQVLSPTEYRVNGIKYVLVNGEIAVEEGEYTGAIAGKGLRKHSVRARS